MIFEIDKKNKNQKALISSYNSFITYKHLVDEVKKTKTFFEKKELVFCMCKNKIGSVIGYISIIENGSVPLLLESKLEIKQFDSFYKIYEPSFLWIPIEDEEKFKSYITKKVYETYGYGLYKTNNNSPNMNDKLALLLATSGSTGSPKLVRLSKKNLESNAKSIKTYLELDENERPITMLPMNYTYGLSVINSHLLSGATVLMTDFSYVQNEFWEFFAREKASSISGVPATYEILKKMRILKKDFPSLKTMTQAGGKLSKSLQKELGEYANKNNIKFFIMYGQTEATARMSYLPYEMCLNKIGSIGIAIPKGEFSIIDENGNEIKTPEVSGELIYKGDNVSLGYAEKKEDLMRGNDRNGILKTGDIAKFDEDRYFYIVGRLKRFIKIFGVRISLDKCEEILKNKYENSEFVCFGEDDNMKIYTTDKNKEKVVSGYLSDYLGLNESGFEGVYIKEFPRNSSGKIMYSGLKEGE